LVSVLVALSLSLETSVITGASFGAVMDDVDLLVIRRHCRREVMVKLSTLGLVLGQILDGGIRHL